MDDFEAILKQGFLEEATQLLTEVEQAFLALESSPDDADIINQIFRIVHNIKGSSKAAGFHDIGSFAHEFESLLLKVKKQEFSVSRPLINLFLRSGDYLKEMVEALKQDLSASFHNQALFDEISLATQGQLTEEEPQTSEFADESPIENWSSVEPATEQLWEHKPNHSEEANPEITEPEQNFAPPLDLDLTEPIIIEPLSNQADEDDDENEPAPSAALPLPSALPTEQNLNSIPGASAAASAKSTPTPDSSHKESHAEESIRVSFARVEKLLDLIGEMVVLQAVLREQSTEETLTVRKTTDQMEKAIKEVQDVSMGLRMIPLKTIFQKMNRVARDTSLMENKKVNLVIAGEDTELDKKIVDSLHDPISNILKLFVSTSIESPQDRQLSGKEPAATIHLRAEHIGGQYFVDILDDGQGLSESEMKNSPLFQAAKKEIDSISGLLSFHSEKGKGSYIRINLPSTLSIIDGMIIRVDKSRFVIPVSQILETTQLSQGLLKKTTGAGEIFLLREKNLPLTRLSSVFNYSSDGAKDGHSTVLVTKIRDEFQALMVDEILLKTQVVLKPLGKEAGEIEGFTGCTILGDGKPAIILDLPGLLGRKRSGHLRVSA